MLPMAAVGALMMPGAVFKILAGIMLVISVAIILVRWRSRNERTASERVAAKPGAAHRRVQTRGRRRDV